MTNISPQILTIHGQVFRVERCWFAWFTNVGAFICQISFVDVYVMHISNPLRHCSAQ